MTSRRLGGRRRRGHLAHHRRRQGLGTRAQRRPRLAAVGLLPQPLFRLGRRPRGTARRRQRRRAALHAGRRRHLAARAAQRPARPERGALRRRQDRLPGRRRLRPATRAACSSPRTAAGAGSPCRGRASRRGWPATAPATATAARWPGPGTASAPSATARPTPSIWIRSAAATCAASGCTARRGVAVGQGGLVLTTDAAGSSWSFAELGLPKNVALRLGLPRRPRRRQTVLGGRPARLGRAAQRRRRRPLGGAAHRPAAAAQRRLLRRRDSTAGRSANWERSWRRPTAARPGSCSGAAASARRRCSSTPAPPGCRSTPSPWSAARTATSRPACA